MVSLLKQPVLRSGFSLLELVVVVVVIGILSAIAIPQYTGYLQKGRDTDAQMSLRSISASQERFKLLYGTYCGPTSNPICNSSATIISNLLSGVNLNTKYYSFTIVSSSATSFLVRADSINVSNSYFSIDQTDCLRLNATTGTGNCL